MKKEAIQLPDKMRTKFGKELSSEQAVEALRKAYEQTELLLSSITSILIGVDEEGRVTHWNPVAEKTFGISSARVLDHPFSKCGIQWDSGLVLSGIRQCRAGMEPVRIDDVPFQRRDGQKGYLGLTVIPLKRETEGSMECILFGADITQRKKTEDFKNEFISTVSHELRTPLTVIKEGVSQVAEGLLGGVNEEQGRFLAIALESIERLGRIVDDLLDISKIEAGKLQLKKTPTDLVSLVKGISLAYAYQAKAKRLEIRARLPPAPVEACVDKDKLTQVWINLISNSLKFTEKGRIEIWVADKGETVECGISDTGMGIAQEDLPRVFGKFQQFGRPAGPGQKGTGLGLAICKGIVELHQGQITVASRLGEGTEVKFVLPKNGEGEE